MMRQSPKPCTQLEIGNFPSLVPGVSIMCTAIRYV